jgi:hypothetical protein
MEAGGIVHVEELAGTFGPFPLKVLKDRELKHALSDTADMMVVNGRPHKGAGDEKRFGSVDTILVKDHPPVCPDQVADEPLCVHGAIRGPGIIGIAEQVVHPVHIKVTVDNARERVLSLHNR